MASMVGDIFSSGLQGGAMGAGTGAMFGGVPGAIIGGGAGLLMGGFQGYQRNKANQGRKKAIGDARMRLEGFARDQRNQRMQDMKSAMALFDPVQDEMRRLYG